VEGFGIRAADGEAAARLFGSDGRERLRPAVETFLRAELGSRAGVLAGEAD
jgi:hypothetical protein